MDSLAFLSSNKPAPVAPLSVVAGDDDFLSRRVRARLVEQFLKGEEPDFALVSYQGNSAEFTSVRNDLATRPFVGNRRVVVVDQADPFVSASRAALEKYLAKPSPVGVLILVVKAWLGTTKLAKLIDTASTFVGKSPPLFKLPQWCVDWAKSEYGSGMEKSAGELLVDLIGEELGVLDQEIRKLSDYVGPGKTVTRREVDELVGRSRGADVYKIMDAVGRGDASGALGILRELFDEGEDAVGVLARLTFSLRGLARTARLVRLGRNVEQALEAAGITWRKDEARAQLRHLGWKRLEQLYPWLIEADSGMKGHSPLPRELVLERLVVRMARARE